MKKIVFILTFISFVSLISPVQAYNPCASIKVNPHISFYTSYGHLTYDYSKNMEEITQISQKYKVRESKLFASGLAVGLLEWNVQVQTKFQQAENGAFCAIPEEINFYMGFNNPKIYIDKNLKIGSCRYNLILRHEKTHQQINVKILDYFVPLFNKALHQISREIPAQPINTTDSVSLNTGANLLVERYGQRLKPLIQIMKKELALEQSKLDNMSNYKFEWSICP